jgi:GGDEF domain-containing protein
VRTYTQQFPNGAHINEARRLLDRLTQPAQVQIAASPEDIAKAEAARKAAEAAMEAAKKAGAEACRKKCESSCKKEAICTKGCVEGACP